jgi:hypothetical protein
MVKRHHSKIMYAKDRCSRQHGTCHAQP